MNLSTVVGSSPLARGLLDPNIGVVGELRIIPARAGFTIDCFEKPPEPRDHPRSRGVYHAQHPVEAGHLGSSPLARGLQETGERYCMLTGIIPARAGFTLESIDPVGAA